MAGTTRPPAPPDSRSHGRPMAGMDGGVPVLWCHVGASVDHQAVVQVLDALDGAEFVVTAGRGVTLSGIETLPLRAGGKVLEPPGALDRFLAEHGVRAALFCGAGYPRSAPALCHGLDIPVVLADAVPLPKEKLNGLLSGLRLRQRPSLQTVDRIFAANPGDMGELARSGIPRDRVEYLGRLTQVVDPPPCLDADRDALAAQIAARPVWCAPGVPMAELDRVAEAHRIASRLSHRLLLILAPERPEDGARIQAALSAQGWTVGLRSRGDEPEADAQIYVADTPRETGLWLRLAPICFAGGSFARPGTGIDLLHAAALGSACLCGPYAGAFQDGVARLQAAKACRRVETADELGGAVTALLAPEQAAAMAARGWEVTSEGAELIQRLASVLRPRLGLEAP